MLRIGIDIGSTNSKLALINESDDILETVETPTGGSSYDSYQSLLNKVEGKGYNLSECKIVSTGYGRDIVENAEKKITEITCHCRGAVKLFNLDDFTLVDIGGQDTKVIDVVNSTVNDFIMNDKCSAGTGRFLDVMARSMGLNITELLLLSSQCSDNKVKISSLCTVFAESEIISLIGKAVPKEQIAHAIVYSIAEKVSSLVGKIKNFGHKPMVLTGGLSNSDIFIRQLSSVLKVEIQSLPCARFAGAVGAALSV